MMVSSPSESPGAAVAFPRCFRLALGALALAGLLGGCASRQQVRPPSGPRVTVEQATRMVPPEVKDREGWAEDVLAALEAHRQHPSPEAVCAVLAIIGQESGFQANPPVPGLSRIVRQRLDEYARKLGPLGPPAIQALLEGRAPGHAHSFEQRLAQVRTERDLDRIFRELLVYYETEYPSTYTAVALASVLFKSTPLEDLNPITTAGSMQVSVRFATELAGGDARARERVREELYTRGGGVYYGTARLLGYEADYTQALHRFADYNAGFYASRNAALQAQVSRLTGTPLVEDGDLLIYDKQGEPVDRDSHSLRALLAFRQRYAPELSERRLRRDVLREKERALEETATWEALKRTFREVTGEEPEYARLPTVPIRSPKLSGEKSTAWFARNVDRRYQACLKRSPAAPAR